MVDVCSIDRNENNLVSRCDGSSSISLADLSQVDNIAATLTTPTEDSCGRTKQRTNKPTIQVSIHRVNPDVLYQIPCIPLHCGFGLVQVNRSGTMPLRAFLQKERRSVNAKVIVLFAIRRPGCGICRLHAQQLKTLDKLERDVLLIGAVKEIGGRNGNGNGGANKTEQALLDFYQQYFRFPMVLDEKWEIFKAMGGRKVGLWQGLTSIPRLTRQFQSEGISNVEGGDMWTQGGVLVFDKEGNLRHTYYETFGELLDLQVLRAAIREARTPLLEAAESSL